MLNIDKVSYAYGKNPVLRWVSLEVETDEIVCLLGESGSGKTTLLRLIAGLEQGYHGTIQLNGEAIDNLPVHKRGFGLMFQDFALFPHLNVEENVAFGLKMLGLAKKEQEEAIAETLDLVGLVGYEKREISSLSGGQKQRVALARSIAPKPRLLMLDEPLGSLDAGLRETLVQDLRRIIKQTGLTAIYVTHDQQEAYAIADRIAVMNRGQIEQYDKPENLYHHPKTAFVARFLGITNLIPSDLLGQFIELPSKAEFVLIHPDSLRLDATGQVVGTVRERVFQGESYRLRVEIAEGINLQLRLSSALPVPEKGEKIRLAVDTNKLLPISNH
jgi:ABC-type Fe3+/spermidine/putrescine transport system ATPase subunit